MDWHPRELMLVRSNPKKHIVWRRTEVLGALLDHLAIDFPQAIASVDDLRGIRADLISGNEVL